MTHVRIVLISRVDDLVSRVLPRPPFRGCPSARARLINARRGPSEGKCTSQFEAELSANGQSGLHSARREGHVVAPPLRGWSPVPKPGALAWPQLLPRS